MAPSTRSKEKEKLILGKAIARKDFATVDRDWSAEEQKLYNSKNMTVLMLTIDMLPGHEHEEFPSYKQMMVFERAIIDSFISVKEYVNVETETFWRSNAENWQLVGPFCVPAGRHWDKTMYVNETEIYAIGLPSLDSEEFQNAFRIFTLEEGEDISPIRFKTLNDELNFRILSTVG